jgi:dsRNA-specific ribonuclease
MNSDKNQDEVYTPDFESGVFKKLIFALLKRGKIKKSTREAVWAQSKQKFIQAFTHPSVNPDCNYEILEMAGDSLVYSTVIQYIKARLPACDCAAGVRILTRIKIDWVSKQFLCSIAEKLGFWRFIHATMEMRNSKRKDLLEDVFEATLQAIYESMLEYKIAKDVKNGKRAAGQRSEVGLSFSVVDTLIRTIYDEIPICGNLPDTLCTDVNSVHNGCLQQNSALIYSMLVDAKTRLKEVFDNFRISSRFDPKNGRGGSVLQTEVTQISCECPSCVSGRTEHRRQQVVYFVCRRGRVIKLKRSGRKKAVASLLKDAQQLAAEEALEALLTQNIVGFMPVSYAQFCEPTPLHPHRQRWNDGSLAGFWANDSSNDGSVSWDSLDEDIQRTKIRTYKAKCCSCRFANCQDFSKKGKSKKR